MLDPYEKPDGFDEPVTAEGLINVTAHVTVACFTHISGEGHVTIPTDARRDDVLVRALVIRLVRSAVETSEGCHQVYPESKKRCPIRRAQRLPNTISPKR